MQSIKFRAATVLLFCAVAITEVTVAAQDVPRYAGPSDKGFLLPNGWTLTPAGQQVALADLPLNIIALADNRHVLASTAGYNTHELCLIDLDAGKVVDRQAVRQGWFGLAVSALGDRVWWSGGGTNSLHAFRVGGSPSRSSGHWRALAHFQERSKGDTFSCWHRVGR